MSCRVAIVLLCVLAGGLFGNDGEIVGEAVSVTAAARHISVKIKDCEAAALADDAALFAYLLQHGFSSASTGEALVDFASPHTRVYRYPDCIIYVRAELTQASTLTTQRRQRASRGDETLTDATFASAYSATETRTDERISATTLREIESAYVKTARRRKRAADPEVAIKFDVKVMALGRMNTRRVFDLSAQAKSSENSAQAYGSTDKSTAAKVSHFTFSDLPWYLDRITGLNGYDRTYAVHPEMAVATQPHWVYHIGTGVMRNHIEFYAPGSNRSIVEPDVFDVYPAQVNQRNSHETFTAALIAGQKFGRGPRNVVIYPATVLDANGEGWLSDISAALHAVYYHLQQHHRDGIPVSINLSLGGPASASFQHELEGVLARLRAEFDAVTFVSAGNDAVDACLITPAALAASVRGVITVASSNINDEFSSFSNYGECVSAIMPGQAVLSASNECASCYVEGSGTSFSAPLLHRLYIIARSVNMTASHVARFPPPAPHRYYCQPTPDEPDVLSTWYNGECVNGTVIYGECDTPDHVAVVYDCLNGTRAYVNDTILQCINGTLATFYTCLNGTVLEGDPEQDAWRQTLVAPAYLPSELALDFLFRYNAHRNVVSRTPRGTLNRLISLRSDLYLNATSLSYGNVQVFSFIGADKPGLNPLKIEVRPYTTLASIERPVSDTGGESSLNTGAANRQSVASALAPAATLYALIVAVLSLVYLTRG